MNLSFKLVLLLALIIPAVLSFECPPERKKRKRPKTTYHRHETHCDKYYVCHRNVATEETCPDGMIFNYKYVNFGRKCVLPQEGDCGGLTEFQPPQPNGPCERQNGYFSSPEDTTCRKYVQCTEGTPTALECPAGTAFAIKSGNCDWPDNVETCSLEKLYGFSCPKNYLLLVLKRGPNVKFPDPEDCRSFFTCGSKGKPRKLGCPLGQVFNDKNQMCDEPENVEGCEKYYKSSSEEEETEEFESEDNQNSKSRSKGQPKGQPKDESDYHESDYDSDYSYDSYYSDEEE